MNIESNVYFILFWYTGIQYLKDNKYGKIRSSLHSTIKRVYNKMNLFHAYSSSTYYDADTKWIRMHTFKRHMCIKVVIEVIPWGSNRISFSAQTHWTKGRPWVLMANKAVSFANQTTINISTSDFSQVVKIKKQTYRSCLPEGMPISKICWLNLNQTKNWIAIWIYEIPFIYQFSLILK